jgi:hypothetical protein
MYNKEEFVREVCGLFFHCEIAGATLASGSHFSRRLLKINNRKGQA